MYKLQTEFLNELRRSQFGTDKQRRDFENGLNKLQEEYKAFFKTTSEDKKRITNYFFPNHNNGITYLGLPKKSGLPKELENKLASLWNSIFEIKE